MEKYIILPDVTCDLSRELQDYFGLTDYIRGYVHFSDGRDLITTMDWDTISRDEFYRALSNRKLTVSTAPMSPEVFYQTFKKYVEEGYKILSMSISSAISSTYNVACTAAERVKEEHPDCTVYCLDSFRMSAAFGLLVCYALDMQKQGKSFDEVVAWLEANKTRVHQMGPIDDLMFVARRGRLSKGKAIMGSFAGVKPMGECNEEGYVTVLTKVKGIKKALDVTAKYVGTVAEDLQDQYIIVSHSDREQYALALKEMIEKEYTPKKVFITDVFDACGTNVGPGMVGVYFLGAPITDLANEKAALNQIVEG